ncbi:MAG: hypothetical protein GX620_14375 [Chloroflexi bacterium]|nr:hypothetical protein [Chloroflexota bacterium]
MRLRDQVMLMPRNNWDYGFGALYAALAGLRTGGTQAAGIERLFDQRPVWTTSGRASLYAILKSLHLPAGANVGVPLFCCSVVSDAICQAGLTPRYLDSGVEDYNVSAEDIDRKRADLATVIAVHMFGHPCDMDAIAAVTDSLPVIEDCAQSLFSTYKDKPTGLLSTAAFFSFRCGKYLSAGEGSAILCADPGLRRRIAETVETFEPWSGPSMLAHALSTFAKATLYHRPWYGLVGYPVGTRLDQKLNLTAKSGFDAKQIAATHLALIETRIAGFEEKIEIQREHARMLLGELAPHGFSLPAENDGCHANWQQFALRFHDTARRDQMAQHLFSKGIDTSKYLDNIAEEARAHYGYTGDCPNAEALAKTVLLVPIHYSLRTRDIETMARAINEAAANI